MQFEVSNAMWSRGLDYKITKKKKHTFLSYYICPRDVYSYRTLYIQHIYIY